MSSKALRILNPQGWPRPRGYSHGIAAQGEQIFVAGQIGWDSEGRFASDQLHDQVRQALENILAVLASAGAGAQHIVRLTWFVTSREEYHASSKQIGAAYRAVMGKHFPAMSVLEISGLMESQAKVEIEATAVIERKHPGA